MKRLVGITLSCLTLLLSVVAAASFAPAAAGSNGTQITYLSGTGKDDGVQWDFMVSAGMQSGEWKKIAVPSNWELQGFGIYNYGGAFRDNANTPGGNSIGRPGFASEQGRYRTHFDALADWKNKVVRIVFDGVMTKAEVWINGKPAGPAHEGSFYQFKYDITPLLRFGGKNLLEVTVSKVADNYSINRAERQGDYWNFGGIFRPVFLEVMPATYIDWTAIDASADGGFRAEVHLGPGVTAPARMTAQILDAKGRPVGAAFSAGVAAGQLAVQMASRVNGAKLWNAETPNLYRVRFALEQHGVAAHVVTHTFGFRTFEIRQGDGLYLNGRKIVMKGVNRHSLWPDSGRTLSRQLNYDDVKLIKDMNMNAVRMSHYPPDRDFLDACDELGLYVLDELAGWQGAYDTPTGARLIGEMVRRDVNHPSIVMWDNGNEGGWNAQNDGEFARWDIQQRKVMHPRSTDRDVNDPHYPTYPDLLSQASGPAIYFPTEFLHGLYDGGGGSGFRDYWDVMSKSPVLGGAFFWVLADDGIVRTDDPNHRIDNSGDLGPDGIVGPARQKEGSFNTIREIWSPVEIDPSTFTAGLEQTFPVQNHYDFINLKQCQFVWSLVNFPSPRAGKAGHEVVATGRFSGPEVAPHGHGAIRFSLPARGAAALYLSALGPDGRELWTWTWPLSNPPATARGRPAGAFAAVQSREDDGQVVVTAGLLELRFTRETGLLAAVARGGRKLSLSNGPRFVGYAINSGPGPARGGGGANTGRTTQVVDVGAVGHLTSLDVTGSGTPSVSVVARYNGSLQQAQWTISSDGHVLLEYVYEYDGPASLLGVGFDYPEGNMRGLTWLGMGPYRVWQNRMQGTRLDVWHGSYNDTVPSVTYSFSPEFKGYLRDWRWATYETSEGTFSVSTAATQAAPSFLGMYTPKDGPVGPLMNLPQTGLAFLDVIPAQRDKFLRQDQLGPQSATRVVSGLRKATVSFDFRAR